jgi:hypothetical protein
LTEKNDSDKDVSEGEDKDKVLPRKIDMKLVIPVVLFTLIAQLLTITLAYGYLSGRVVVPAYEPFGSSIPGSVGNSLLLIVTVLIVTFTLVWLVRSKRFDFIRRFLMVFLSFTGFFLTYLLGQIILPSIMSLQLRDQTSIILALGVSMLIGYTSIKQDSKVLGVITSLILAVEVATYLAIFIRPPTLFILPVAFALYDLYAVFLGPLKTLIADKEFALGPLAAKLGSLEVGLGDIAFYSLLPAAGLIVVGIQAAILTIIATNIGLLFTLFMLRNRRSFPGLPIPVLLGTVGLLLMI